MVSLLPNFPPTVDRDLSEMGFADRDVPWWAVSLLELPVGSPARRIRLCMEQGMRPRTHSDKAPLDAWPRVVEEARRLAERYHNDPLEALAAEPGRVRHAALRSQRAFCDFVGLQTDDLTPLVLKDFHVRAVNAMRRYPLAEILLPFSHGKSFLSSILVPLMDWVENVESTQIRVYYNESYTSEWTMKLMDLVENCEPLHRLSQGKVMRPGRRDPCYGIWSTKAFAIAGKRVVDPSWRPYTMGSKLVGKRADRVGADDWVNDGNCSSEQIQDKMMRFFKSGMLTYRRRRDASWHSHYHTKWGTAFLVGTIYDRRDIGWRLYCDWKDKVADGSREHRVIKESVYPFRKDKSVVLWPEERPLAWVREQEEQLDTRAFRLRCLNQPDDDGSEIFKEDWVKGSLRPDLPYGEPPDGCRLIFGYDPALGRYGRISSRAWSGRKNPAAVLLGFAETGEVHFIAYERWNVSQPQQVARIVDWCRRYGCPVVIEQNNQEGYVEWIKEMDPKGEVKVHTHTTSKYNKLDKADGVESFVPLFEHGKVAIHTGLAPPGHVEALVSEFVDWPQGRYKDLVMAAWFAKFRWTEMNRPTGMAAEREVPWYVNRGPRSHVDLRSYR